MTLADIPDELASVIGAIELGIAFPTFEERQARLNGAA
jgi:hypothetical protein